MPLSAASIPLSFYSQRTGSSETSQALGSLLDPIDLPALTGEVTMSETPDPPPPPAVGELLPRVAEAFGVRYKLETYSLDLAHEHGGPKARGFELILGITIEAIDYLEAQIMTRILDTPIREVRDNPPYGINCVVYMPIRGIGAHGQRVVSVRTVWLIGDPGEQPRLVTAFIDA
jgi:hypothetical protein